MKVLVIGGNRFVGLRLTHALAQDKSIDLNIVNRTGQAPHADGAAVYKADRTNWLHSHIDKDWDVIVDFAAFNDKDAIGAMEYFTNVKRYIFISSVSVYDDGENLSESIVDPMKFDLSAPLRQGNPQAYQDGKRRAEAAFHQLAPFPAVSVRFPFILGPDDYTRRLEFHVQRVENGQPICAPKPDSRFSLIHAEDACRFLIWSMTQTFAGPLNVASPTPLSMTELLRRIEKKVGRKTLLAQTASIENASPYAAGKEWFMDVTKAKNLGFEARPYEKWLGELIEAAIENPPAPSQLH